MAGDIVTILRDGKPVNIEEGDLRKREYPAPPSGQSRAG